MLFGQDKKSAAGKEPDSTLIQFLLIADSKSAKNFKYTPHGTWLALKNLPEGKPALLGYTKRVTSNITHF